MQKQPHKKVEQFSFIQDKFNSLHLHAQKQQMQILPQVFQTLIAKMLSTGDQKKYKAIWVHLGQKNLGHISSLIKKDFTIHRGIGKQVSLYKWIGDYLDSVPPFSRFYIGCGALVIKDDHVFLVKQKSGERKGFFNLPGGRADRGQSIQQAVQRELFQQTGLKGNYQYIIYFRQLAKSVWNSSDIYFVSMVSVQQDQLKNLSLCQKEIESVQWVHLNDYYSFTKANSVGTQIEVSRHITQLYKSGFDFIKMANTTYQTFYSKKNKIPYVGHFIVNPQGSTFPSQEGIQLSEQNLG